MVSPLNQNVTKFLNALNHPLRNEIEELRKIILEAENALVENIKWNGPNYSINNEDRITLKIQPPKQLQLIFHRGAKVKEQPKQKIITEASGFLIWKANDRAVLSFKNLEDIQKNKHNLKRIINDWIVATQE
tara:strand:- start:66749 stop:67144 length:396 start_codon:yes stop_codon:yes gene_type:complete